MGIRERTPRAKMLKQRRCGKCGSLLNPKLKRCKRCHVPVR